MNEYEEMTNKELEKEFSERFQILNKKLSIVKSITKKKRKGFFLQKLFGRYFKN